MCCCLIWVKVVLTWVKVGLQLQHYNFKFLIIYLTPHFFSLPTLYIMIEKQLIKSCILDILVQLKKIISSLPEIESLRFAHHLSQLSEMKFLKCPVSYISLIERPLDTLWTMHNVEWLSQRGSFILLWRQNVLERVIVEDANSGHSRKFFEKQTQTGDQTLKTEDKTQRVSWETELESFTAVNSKSRKEPHPQSTALLEKFLGKL